MNILEQANDIVNKRSEEKERQYGPFSEGMRRAAMIASGMTGKDFDAGDMYAAGFLSQFFKTNDYIASGKIGSALAEEIVQINGAQFDKKKMSQIRSNIF